MPLRTFLLDTNVLSEAQFQRPHPAVSAWLSNQDSLAIPFPALLEIENGIVRATPERARRLRAWVDELLKSDFIFPDINADVSRQLAQLQHCAALKHLWMPNPGSKKQPSQDLFIAAIAIVHSMPIATMDTSDFELINIFFPLPGLFNPLTSEWSVDVRRKWASHGCGNKIWTERSLATWSAIAC